MKISKPFGVAMGVYWLLTLALLATPGWQTGGRLSYPQDDTYIHMAMAKQWATHGVWGITTAGFTSSTSSPLWTFLLGVGYRLFGVNEWLPLALNVLCGTGVVVFGVVGLRSISQPTYQTAGFLLLVLLMPLPILTLTGMEHVLHGLLTWVTLHLAATLLAAPTLARRPLALLLLLTALLPMARYEGLFLVCAIGLGFFATRRWGAGLLVWVAGWLPVIGYGWLSVQQGWYFLPNSVWLKGAPTSLTLEGLSTFFSRLPMQLFAAPQLLLLLVGLLLTFVWAGQTLARAQRLALALYLAMFFLHLQFALIGYRYEAYLILVGLALLASQAGALLPTTTAPTRLAPQPLAAMLLSVVLIFPLAWRTGLAFRDYGPAVRNIYEQQYQMAQFVRQSYPGQWVALNDIGAVSYYADVEVLDLVGLANMEVAQLKRAGPLQATTLAQLVQAHPVAVVIVYNTWFPGQIPATWVEVGRWRILNSVAAGGDTVSFYAPTPAQQAALIARLQAFAPQLPPTVIQSGLYVRP